MALNNRLCAIVEYPMQIENKVVQCSLSEYVQNVNIIKRNITEIITSVILAFSSLMLLSMALPTKDMEIKKKKRIFIIGKIKNRLSKSKREI